MKNKTFSAVQHAIQRGETSVAGGLILNEASKSALLECSKGIDDVIDMFDGHLIGAKMLCDGRFVIEFAVPDIVVRDKEHTFYEVVKCTDRIEFSWLGEDSVRVRLYLPPIYDEVIA